MGILVTKIYQYTHVFKLCIHVYTLTIGHTSSSMAPQMSSLLKPAGTRESHDPSVVWNTVTETHDSFTLSYTNTVTGKCTHVAIVTITITATNHTGRHKSMA